LKKRGEGYATSKNQSSQIIGLEGLATGERHDFEYHNPGKEYEYPTNKERHVPFEGSIHDPAQRERRPEAWYQDKRAEKGNLATDERGWARIKTKQLPCFHSPLICVYRRLIGLDGFSADCWIFRHQKAACSSFGPPLNTRSPDVQRGFIGISKVSLSSFSNRGASGFARRNMLARKRSFSRVILT
jgi:hypothetical protein